MVCNKCGKEIEKGYPVCLNCGQKCEVEAVEGERKKDDRKVQLIIIIIVLILVISLFCIPVIMTVKGVKQMSEAYKELESMSVNK